MMPKNQPTPAYKFRLLCRRCNSYLHTRISSEPSGDLVLWCGKCDVTAHDLDEVKPT